ncbi:glutamine--tRNA ligase-like protein [Tanacetum coccineum]|uniref:glutamine--tRNA ligase n=1 Tax=Tanacetum coccineum TaxID=301880 RepID=A0ABQ5A0V1_9ASTR
MGSPIVDLFVKIGLNKQIAEETIANNKVTTNLLAVIDEAGVTKGCDPSNGCDSSNVCDPSTGNLLYRVATEFPANALVHRPTLLKYIVSSKIKTPPQLKAALAFLEVTGSGNLDINKFEEDCGVGIDLSREAIKPTVDKIFKEKESAIIEQRYNTNVGDLFGHVLKEHPWADTKRVKELIDENLKVLLGEKTTADNEKPLKKKKEKPAKVEGKGATKEAPEAVPSKEDPFSIFPAPEENYKVHTEVSFSNRDDVLRACNSKTILKEHLEATGGKVRTRFPPEPNGHLHIGHAKAMFADFGLAEDRGGGCYLRFDDTNPEVEKKEYIDHIKEIVDWMGWEPFKITYTSDYFQKLYDLAVDLICRGHAYVDHQTGDEIKEYREKKMNSPWRDRRFLESLKLFNDMKEGRIDEGKATLRMKQDMQNANALSDALFCMDPQFIPHPHAGDKWCIYPSYDYAHCIVDSLENITHSLCTLEFETRRASYYWLLDALSLYQPYVGEYSRLNITHTVLSKRKINSNVLRIMLMMVMIPFDDTSCLMRDMCSLSISTAINTFVRGLGISRSDGSVIPLEHFEHQVRKELHETAPRTMVVLDPLKVVITNLASSVKELNAKKWPNAPDDDTYYRGLSVPFSNVVYIEQKDFRLKDSKGYNGLAPGKKALLSFVMQGVLHWVDGVDPLKVEVRLFNKLFKSENPGELDNWLDDLNPESKVVIPCAYAARSLKSAEVGDKFQFERNGYFVVDKDSTPEKLIFNRTVALTDTYKGGSK